MKARLWKGDHLARWAGEASVARIRAGIARARNDDVRWSDRLRRVLNLEGMGYRLGIAAPAIEPPEVYGATLDEDPRWSDILRRVVG
jgi:hypothetical protein